MKWLFLVFIAGWLSTNSMLAQDCEASEISVLVKVQCDQFAQETSWEITNHKGQVIHRIQAGEYSNNTYYETTLCLPATACYNFLIHDKFGDGFREDGHFQLVVGDSLIADNPDFKSTFFLDFNCWPGSDCRQAKKVQEGKYEASPDVFWFLFKPDSTGAYQISTCDSIKCDTKIWVYGSCRAGFDESNRGTIFFDDDNNNCGQFAVLNGYFSAERSYYIKVSGAGVECIDGRFDFTIDYEGPITGCTDPNSCNYNPLASIDDGNCIPQGSDDCPDGPDLALDESIFRLSIEVDSINAEDKCLIDEKCLTGYGMREIIRFTTRFSNIGETDYYIGQPEENPNQFSFDNCHNHHHYNGYAEYLLYDDVGTKIPIGFKTGFCVIDYGCDQGEKGKYSCENMGISSNCYDEYYLNLDCQWIDITDVVDGYYVLVNRINWDNAPDALGRKEKNMANNWVQTCVIIDRSSGELKVEVRDNCPVFVDCAGEVFGEMQPDCAGICGGPALRGDMNEDGIQNQSDFYRYLFQALDAPANPSLCFDLNEDAQLDVYDVALFYDCLSFKDGHEHNGGASHDHCSFPAGILNQQDTAAIFIDSIDAAQGFIDLTVLNKHSNFRAFQVTIDAAITIDRVVPLYDANVHSAELHHSLLGEVIGLFKDSSSLQKSAIPQPLLRVFFREPIQSAVCIKIKSLVNENYELITTQYAEDCVTFTTSTTTSTPALNVQVLPNPAQGATWLHFDQLSQQAHLLEIYDAAGRLVERHPSIINSPVRIALTLPAGIYSYRLSNTSELAVGNFVLSSH